MVNAMLHKFLGDHRGNAVIEFAIAMPLLVVLSAGVFQLGYAFYLYNNLRNGVHLGARYGAAADYTEGASTFDNAVKNIVVYGTPSPDQSAAPLINSLTTDHVTVTPVELDTLGVPRRIKVSISGYDVPSIWYPITFTGKPSATFSYMGQFIDE